MDNLSQYLEPGYVIIHWSLIIAYKIDVAIVGHRLDSELIKD